MKGCEDQLVTSHRANLNVMNLNFEREEILLSKVHLFEPFKTYHSVPYENLGLCL